MAAARMTQTQLVRHLAERCQMNNKVARQFLDELAKVAIQETKKNSVFVLPGVGRLVKSSRKARMGRNPATGEAIKIPSKTIVKFRVAQAAKEAIVPGGKGVKFAEAGGITKRAAAKKVGGWGRATWCECPIHGPYEGPPPCPQCTEEK